jgi:hypothetical protein
MAAPIFPRCPGDTCVVCRRQFKRGDRVEIVNIVERVGVNPSNNREVGSWLSPEFEIRHANCADTSLEGTVILGGTT